MNKPALKLSHAGIPKFSQIQKANIRDGKKRGSVREKDDTGEIKKRRGGRVKVGNAE